MIKVNKGKCVLKGRAVDLLTELTTATRSVVDALKKNGMPEEDAKEMVKKSFDLALMSKEEICKELYEEVTKLSDSLFEALFGEEREGK